MENPGKLFVFESIYRKFAGAFSKFAVNCIYIVILSTNKHHLKTSWGVRRLGKNNPKSLQGQDGKEFFRKTNKVHKEICKMYYTYFQSATEIYFLRKTKVSICIIFFPVPTILETAMKAL